MLQPSTSICVSCSVHFLRGFFCTTNASWDESSEQVRILTLRSGTWSSSCAFQAGTRRDTRRCFGGESSDMGQLIINGRERRGGGYVFILFELLSLPQSRV